MSGRSWLLYAEDMRRFAKRALSVCDGLSKEALLASPLHYDATLRNLELIGEAARYVPSEVCQRYPSIPWRRVIGLRNRLVHAYLGIDDDVIWSVIEHDLTPLIAEIEVLLERESDRQ